MVIIDEERPHGESRTTDTASRNGAVLKDAGGAAEREPPELVGLVLFVVAAALCPPRRGRVPVFPPPQPSVGFLAHWPTATARFGRDMVRDTTNRDGLTLTVTAGARSKFTSTIKAMTYKHPARDGSTRRGLRRRRPPGFPGPGGAPGRVRDPSARATHS